METTDPMPPPLIILGSGYTARFLWPLATATRAHVLATSRSPDLHLDYVPPAQRLAFDLNQPNTWTVISPQADLLWCFPAQPLDLVVQFAATLGLAPRRLVVLGSTSAYDGGPAADYPPPWIDETSPIDLSKPRVQGEEHLRTAQGAIILRVAGIYGPDRNPIEWLRRGRVVPSRKYVNLIHVNDLAAICLLALERGTPGGVYNVSDGQPRTWQAIGEFAQQRWGITAPTAATTSEPGKRLSTKKLTHDFGYKIRHHDLYQELAQLTPL